MKISPWFIGIDLGTGSCKSVVINGRGKVLGFGVGQYGGSDPDPKWQEQDPRSLLPAATASVRTAVERSGLHPEGCSGLSIGGALHSVLALDAGCNPLTGVITWADGRALDQSREIGKSPQGRALYQETGCPVHGMYPLYKIKWLHDVRPEIFGRTVRFVSAKEYVLSQLLGEFVVDYSLASGSGLLNIRNLQWSESALEAAGIRKEHLSPLSHPAAVFGSLKRNVAEEMSIPHDTPVVLGSSDAVNSSLGAGAVFASQATCMVGTSGALRVISTRPIFDEKGRTWCYAIDGEHWLVGGAINNGGIALAWLRDSINSALKISCFSEGLSFEEIIRLAGMAQAGAGGVICLPFFAGERSPNWNPNARAVFFGLTLEHDYRHLSRSVLEGIAFRFRSLMEALAGIGLGQIRQILLSGGFTKSDLWIRIISDALNRELTAPVWGETSALGAAFWAMVGTGHLERIEDVQKLVEMGESYHPDPLDVAVYDRIYPLYTQLYHALIGAFDEVALLQHDLSSR